MSTEIIGLNQQKLTKGEWESLEVPVSPDELRVLRLIVDGYRNVSIRSNKHISLLSYLHVESSDAMEAHLYETYFQASVSRLREKMVTHFPLLQNTLTRKTSSSGGGASKLKLNTADKIRLERHGTVSKDLDLYDEVLLRVATAVVESFRVGVPIKDFYVAYYTLHQLMQNTISGLNLHLVAFVQTVLTTYRDSIDLHQLVGYSVACIEKNTDLMKYCDLTLYDHQKQLYSLFRTTAAPTPRLVLYTAPTGTGKTLSPLGLSEEYKVLFVCAAKHVGMGLAKSAISLKKRVAFAFGCETGSDVRLHNYSAVDFVRNKWSGGIGKVDHTRGDLVEIMISDIRSFKVAMLYMLAFFERERIIVYWDEPTISMDYSDHEFHAILRDNWKENMIPNVVLSSATLPGETEIPAMLADFRSRFAEAGSTTDAISRITSHDCKKSISLVNRDGRVVMPHLLYPVVTDMQAVAIHCIERATMLRYFDLKEVVEFIRYMAARSEDARELIGLHMERLEDVSLRTVKLYYLSILMRCIQTQEEWDPIYQHFQAHWRPVLVENTRAAGTEIRTVSSIGPGVVPTDNTLAGQSISRLNSTIGAITPAPVGTTGVNMVTKDAYTYTDGPTIVLTNDVHKMANALIKMANISQQVMDQLMAKIAHNNTLNEQIHERSVQVDAMKERIEQQAANEVSAKNKGVHVTGRNKSGSKRMHTRETPEEYEGRDLISRLSVDIHGLQSQLQRATLPDVYIPNRAAHLDKWAPTGPRTGGVPFTSSVDEDIVVRIMGLHGVDDIWKVLLIMGIGAFLEQPCKEYTEIMKNLAYVQRLYMVIASPDFIYGTNYQYCHGFLTQDLSVGATQEKIVQAIGRVGRGHIQQTYTVRFRDDAMIRTLFDPHAARPEADCMNRLFA